MLTKITALMNLKEIEGLIQNEIESCEFWGDLDLSLDEFALLGDIIRNSFRSSSVSVELMCKSYPHCMTTYMVFFAIYSYDASFWGALSDAMKIRIPQPQQDCLGACARRMFDEHDLDYSESMDEARRNIAPIMYEACIPPDSSIEDLFYVLSNDSHRVFDPHLIIDDLIYSRSYSIRKPLLRFVTRFREDRAVNFILEVYDAIQSAENLNYNKSRYTNSYSEWKSKAVLRNAEKKHNIKDHQAIPYIFFDEGKNGLSLMLPFTIIESEWVDSARWIVTTQNGFERIVDCHIFGDEGRRYTVAIPIPVPPDESYTVRFQDDSILDDDSGRRWSINGIPLDEPVWFNSYGRQVNTSYLLSPYGILVFHKSVSIISTRDIDVQNLYYPNNVEHYSVVSVSALSGNASMVLRGGIYEREYRERPHFDVQLKGKTLFDVNSENVFTEIPMLMLSGENVSSNEVIELRMGINTYDIELGANTKPISLSECFPGELEKYGAYNIRLYHRGRFIRQLEYYLVPNIVSTYSSVLCWPRNRKELTDIISYEFQKTKGWDLSFEGCDVVLEDDIYKVEVPRNRGVIRVSLSTVNYVNRVNCCVVLPINPFTYDIQTVQGDMVEENAKLLLSDLKSLTDKELWLNFKSFDSFKSEKYSLALRTINGIEQKETIKINNKGSGNLNLGAFYDTIKTSVLPLEIVLLCDSDDNGIPVVFVSDSKSFSKPVRHVSKEKADYVVISSSDEKKNLEIKRFGFNSQSVYLEYSRSRMSKNYLDRYYPSPERMQEGLYLVSGEEAETIFDFEDESVDIDIGNNLLYVRCHKEDNRIKTSKHLLDSLIKDLISKPKGVELKKSLSYEILMDDEKLKYIQSVQFDDCDIEKLVALAFFYNSKIEKEKKKLIDDIMRKISVSLMKRGDRYRIIELLVDLGVSQEVFDACYEKYFLLLVYSDNEKRKILASRIEKYSPELSMILMMSTDGSIRDCMWKTSYFSVIGKEAIQYFLTVPGAENNEIAVNEQKKFVREEINSKVRIRFDNELAGDFEVIQGHIKIDKWHNAHFEIPPLRWRYGIYFADIKYVDQYINWYLNTHDKHDDMKPEIRQLMKSAVNEYKDDLNKSIESLLDDPEIGNITSQYMDVISHRIVDDVSTSSYAYFFYLQGIAAYLSRLPVGVDYYDKRRIFGIGFMTAASLIAPKLSRRDILMAQVYIYLKRKEVKLCQ